MTPKNGSWDMGTVKFTSGATVPPWTYLWVKRPDRPGLIEQNGLLKTVVIEFKAKMADRGLSVPDPIVPGPSIVLNAGDAAQKNDQLIDTIMQSISTRVGMVLVLLPDMDAAVYSRIKYASDVLFGVHTVCALDANAAKDKGRDQYLANIALKVNCKLLGKN